MKFEGVYVSAVTPRRQRLDAIDLASTWELIDFLGAQRVAGIVLMASAGEFVHFPVEERIRVMGLAVKRSRAPLLVNVSHSTLDGAVRLAEAAMAANCAALLLAPPHFFRYDQADILAFYTAFAQEVEARVPVLLYNAPAFSNPIAPDTAAALLNGRRFAGLIDSGGDWPAFDAFRTIAQGNVLCGHDGLFVEARAGASLSAAACAVPELMLALNRALQAGSPAPAQTLAARLEQFLAAAAPFPVPIAIREAVAARRLKVGAHATALSYKKEQALAEFREWFGPWLKVVQKECAVAQTSAN
ncbi:MAG: dihydrodipicolinate synthase family protein [Acidobacteria bacterium]|nr:dihydrodipicolinate synthase family protein [Acidobacteriota bacterium]